MSVVVLSIAAVHMIPIVITAAATRRRGPTIVATGIMVIVAFALGTILFVGWDLAAIALAYWWSRRLLAAPAKPVPVEAAPPATEPWKGPARPGSIFLRVLGGAFLLAIILAMCNSPPQQSTLVAPPINDPAPAPPVRATPAVAPAPEALRETPPAPALRIQSTRPPPLDAKGEADRRRAVIESLRRDCQPPECVLRD